MQQPSCQSGKMINIEKAVAALLSGETRFDTIYGAEFVFYIPAGRASSQRMRLQLQARARSLTLLRVQMSNDKWTRADNY
jgi:hypothetical protein